MKQKLNEWARRYVPAEVLSFLITLFMGILVYKLSGNRVTTALAATWSGNAGYYGFILYADFLKTLENLKNKGASYSVRNLKMNLKTMVIEFGLGEIVDSLFIRPALMYFIPVALGNLALGICVAKLVADVCFYIPTLIGYEFNKRFLGE